MKDTLTGQESRKPRKGAAVKGIVRNTKSMTERRHWKKKGMSENNTIDHNRKENDHA